MKSSEFARSINQLAGKREPFFFLIDFEMEKPFVCRLKEAVDHGVWFDMKGHTNIRGKRKAVAALHPSILPVSRQQYHEAFSLVMNSLQRGDAYLVNLTFPTRIELDVNLSTLFRAVQAPYKLFFRGQFLVFSPECFIRIKDDKIFTYPMKGTIDASFPDAEKQLLSNPKELFEHNTVVDLLRNDLSMVSERVEVLRYRFIDRIITQQRELLQVSSEIAGNLFSGWQKQLGDMLVNLLPAGSVSGAPKQKTLEIICEAENENRGYYTGIFGIFDGENLESAVNIRYIENTAQGLRYRSGGGITALSNEEEEYHELINKVYVPAF